MANQGQEFVNTSGQSGAQLPDQLRGWNWGAFLMNWIWAIAHRAWLGFVLAFFLGIIGAIVCGIVGNEWAWKNRRWQGIQQFKDTQRVWAIVGLVFLVLGLLCAFIAVLILALVAGTR